MNFFISFAVLLVVNLIPVFFSNRKRKYGLYSIPVFAFIFSLFWIYVFIITQGFLTEKPNLQRTNTRDNAANATAMRINEALLQKQALEQQQNRAYHIGYIAWTMRLSGAQSAVICLFSVIGLLTINNRNKYYIAVLLGSLVMLLFCLFLLENIDSLV